MLLVIISTWQQNYGSHTLILLTLHTFFTAIIILPFTAHFPSFYSVRSVTTTVTDASTICLLMQTVIV